jgi:hypothetical protein
MDIRVSLLGVIKQATSGQVLRQAASSANPLAFIV